MRQFLYEIKIDDIGKSMFRLPNCKNLLGQGWGEVMECDVEKRLFLVGGIIQIENNEQRDKRLLKNSS